jgi:hypothetical protein
VVVQTREGVVVVESLEVGMAIQRVVVAKLLQWYWWWLVTEERRRVWCGEGGNGHFERVFLFYFSTRVDFGQC